MHWKVNYSPSSFGQQELCHNYAYEITQMLECSGLCEFSYRDNIKGAVNKFAPVAQHHKIRWIPTHITFLDCCLSL